MRHSGKRCCCQSNCAAFQSHRKTVSFLLRVHEGLLNCQAPDSNLQDRRGKSERQTIQAEMPRDGGRGRSEAGEMRNGAPRPDANQPGQCQALSTGVS